MIQVSEHIHRGDGHTASIGGSGASSWLDITDINGNEIAFFIPEELRSDAETFAESINTFCQPRVKAVGA